MLGLLQAYGSDESGSESDNDIDQVSDASTAAKLPNPFDLPSSNIESVKDLPEKSVFINPYVLADQAKKALLEKHVKMISTDVKTVNGKKICWNYRKNKCRFGHNCKYAHDSDLQTNQQSTSENKISQSPFLEGDDTVDESTLQAKGKKRPGLSQSITPNRKVMKMYYDRKK